jgi:formylglycine-generating enzyme required for sulfatase activity
MTLTGDLVGTPAYLSPEQIAALRIELDRRTDIWSLGVTLHECLTLERPFEGATRDQLYQQILTAEPAPLRQRNPRVSRDLEIVVATALQKDRNRRYQTARDFAEDLRRIVAHEPIRARPPGPLARLARWTRRNPGLAAATALAFFGLSLGLLLSLAYVAEARRARTAFQRLDDVTLLAQARAAADSLYPILPARAAGFAGWVERHGAPLAARLPAHRAELERLRAHALPRDPAADERLRRASPLQGERAQMRAELEAYEVAEVPGENRRAEVVRHVLGWLADRSRARLDAIDAELAALRAWRFAALEAQAAHDALAALVADLERFTAPDGLAARIAREAGIAAAMATGGGSDADWAAAAARVRADARYRGQALARQPGLVPLGPDPDSRLEEFALFGSGAVPARDPATGRLATGPEHAAVLVLVPPGELRPAADELQPEPVRLDRFLIGKHELTRGQWRRMFAEPPPNSDLVLAAGDPRDELPVDAVAWVVADRLLPRWDLCLPTEAQWEHAARGGSGGRHWWGDGLPPTGGAPPANIADASYVVATGQVRRLPVGYDDGHVLLAPIGVTLHNGHGLGDVYGNVAELCREPFAGALPLGRFPFDAGDGLHRVPPTRQRVVRGGWFGAAWRTIGLAERDGIPETVATVGVGVRVARRVTAK